jgi:hypothetical protein
METLKANIIIFPWKEINILHPTVQGVAHVGNNITVPARLALANHGHNVMPPIG